jgi:hypothetical protein
VSAPEHSRRPGSVAERNCSEPLGSVDAALVQHILCPCVGIEDVAFDTSVITSAAEAGSGDVGMALVAEDGSDVRL